MLLALITAPSTSSCLTTGEARASGAPCAADPLQALRAADHDVANYGDVVVTPPTPQRDA